MIKSPATVVKVSDDSEVVIRSPLERALLLSGDGVPSGGPGVRETDRFAGLG